MLFWKNYEYLCSKNNLSVYDVAKQCGVKSTGTVSYWKQGSTPRPDVLSKIADLFAVQAQDLLYTDLDALETLNSSSNADDPIYSAILKLTPQKRALAMAFIAGLTSTRD